MFFQPSDDLRLVAGPFTLFYCPVAKQVANNTPNLVDPIPIGSALPPNLNCYVSRNK